MITVSVCIGSACHKRGSYAILNRFKQLVRQHGAEDKVNVAPVFCLGECANGVSVKIDDQLVLGMCEDNVDATWEQLVLARIG